MQLQVFVTERFLCRNSLIMLGAWYRGNARRDALVADHARLKFTITFDDERANAVCLARIFPDTEYNIVVGSRSSHDPSPLSRSFRA